MAPPTNVLQISLISFLISLLILLPSHLSSAQQHPSLPAASALQTGSDAGEYFEPADETHCRGEWRYPAACESVSCDYKATWEYHDEGDEIVFTISTKKRNKWTGIGFSENQAMPETDTILGLVEER